MRALFARLPLAQTLSGYRREWLIADLIGGLSVCVVMVPSVVAYAGLAGLPPVQGLYAALLGMVGYAIFASSRHVIVGPDAALTLLVAAAIAPFTVADPSRAPVLAAALAIIGGVLLLATALLRAGVAADLLSRPVLVGYLTGASLILISTQLGKFFGVSLQEKDFFAIVTELVRRRPEIHGWTTWLGIGLVLLQLVLRAAAPKVPVALVVFVVAIGFSLAIDLPARGVALVGTVESGLPRPAIPWIQASELVALVPGALGLALLTIPESILLARAFSARHRYEIKPNQEIAAIGVANVLAGSFQGFSVSASQSRTSVNDSAGGKTPISGFVAAGGLVLVLLFLTPLLARLPSVALAAILVVAGAQLIEFRQYRALLRFTKGAFVLALVVMLGVLVLGVVQGIMLGIAISLVQLIGRLARPMDALLREVPGTSRYHDLADDDDRPAHTVPGLVAYRFYAPLMFANAEHFLARIRTLIARSPTPVRCLVLDAQAIWDVDSTAAEVLSRLRAELTDRGIELKVARANRPLRAILERAGLKTELGLERYYTSVHAAVESFQGSTNVSPART